MTCEQDKTRLSQESSQRLTEDAFSDARRRQETAATTRDRDSFSYTFGDKQRQSYPLTRVYETGMVIRVSKWQLKQKIAPMKYGFEAVFRPSVCLIRKRKQSNRKQ